KELHPDVITLDVMMPSMDGWAVLTRLKADPDLSTIPVVMLTMASNKNLGYTLGAAEYLIKPVEKSSLVKELKKYQSAKQTSSVLVVEDDAETREMLTRSLENQGWDAEAAENGRVGLEHIRAHRPGLILLDLMMPEMDGFEFLAELRKVQTWHSIPVVVITAMDLSPEDRQRLNGQVQKVLQKGGYKRDELLNEVKNWVKESLAAREERATAAK